ncbi:hypothetical protein C0992_012370 [Termitomyces sp. T32_za158]|nr:hypothetical protein C0992_012370 [Termitomyces sp. T32_za158]
MGWRPYDLERAYSPFGHGVGIQIGRSDPVFMARYGREPVHERPDFPYDSEEKDRLFLAGDEKTREAVFFGTEWVKELTECNYSLYRDLEDLKFLRKNWQGPLVLKGIQSVLDAEKALECGRQIDGAIPSVYALENIMKSVKVKEAQASGKLTVLFDSGIRTGPDIFKALALGAQAVLRQWYLHFHMASNLIPPSVGRPWIYGLIVGGETGVEQVIRHTLADLDTTLGLAGYRSLGDVQGKRDAAITKLDFVP